MCALQGATVQRSCGSISRYNVSWAVMPTSSASILDLSVVLKLKTLVLGSNLLTKTAIKK
jgi:hypothetical protein